VLGVALAVDVAVVPASAAVSRRAAEDVAARMWLLRIGAFPSEKSDDPISP
jgi:hypothetical protein